MQHMQHNKFGWELWYTSYWTSGWNRILFVPPIPLGAAAGGKATAARWSSVVLRTFIRESPGALLACAAFGSLVRACPLTPARLATLLL